MPVIPCRAQQNHTVARPLKQVTSDPHNRLKEMLSVMEGYGPKTGRGRSAGQPPCAIDLLSLAWGRRMDYTLTQRHAR